jgi:hypothetical protein
MIFFFLFTFLLFFRIYNSLMHESRDTIVYYSVFGMKANVLIASFEVLLIALTEIYDEVT